MKNEEYTGELKVNSFKQSEKKEKKYLIMLNRNFTKEFNIGRTWYRFEPYQTLEVNQSVIEHPDFIQQKEYFSIKEL